MYPSRYATCHPVGKSNVYCSSSNVRILVSGTNKYTNTKATKFRPAKIENAAVGPMLFNKNGKTRTNIPAPERLIATEIAIPASLDTRGNTSAAIENGDVPAVGA
jgi:hypothetical protein